MSKGRYTASVGSIQRGKRIALMLRILLAIVMLIFALFPILWIISASFNPTGSLVGQPLIPQNPTLANYQRLFNDPVNPYPRWYVNSLFIATTVTVVATAITTLAAYAFSRFNFRSRRPLLQAILLIQVFPNFLNMVALFLILQQFGSYIPAIGLNTYGGLFLVYLGGTLGANTWLTKGYFDSIPRDLDEAATVDGASGWQVFWVVLLPLVRPILVVVALLTFIGTYSEFVLARVLLTDKMMYTLAVGLNQMVANQFAQSWGVFSAGALLAALPTIILFMFFQRYLVGGLTTGAVKG
ncbi:MAG: sugar ABC transporter permease [Caldilinea sp.]|uniref:sugar ABC transporter permease n=1 Tax=Caldilinea sp. TaxID=2293560 RepID=UPI002CE7E1D8|nr:sugar ABC transporter permease [Anaerolineales bacterium]HQY90523.1 sugar ABC transporter permease [Caldilinea sp.]